MTDSFQRIQIYGKPDANGNIIPVANIFASQTGNIVSYIPGENIEFVVDQTTGNILLNAPSYKPMADYWRTFRNFETNASIIADQSQDVITFKGGEHINISFNEGADLITWNADLQGIISDVTANLNVNNEAPVDNSMLEYDPASATFTYYPPDLSDYATFSYVDSAVASGVANVNLDGYATEVWVQGYVGTAVNIPALSEYVRQDEYNQDLILLNQAITDIPAGYTGSKGDAGSSVKIVGSVETYSVLTSLPRWTNYLGQIGDGVLLEDTGNLAVATIITPYPTTWTDVGPIQGPPGNQGPRGYTGSKGDRGYTGSQGVIGYTGSQGIQGFTGSIGFTGSASTVQGPTGFTGSQGIQGNIGYTGSAIIAGHYVHDQNVASNLWVVNHNLGVQYLSVELVDDSGNTLVGTYSYPTITFVDENTTTVSWSYATTGKLILVAGLGPKGDRGDTGYTGSRGFTGSVGLTGSTGAFAAVGFDGSRGIQGPQGFSGSVGFTGSTGTTIVTTVYAFADLPTNVSAGARAFMSDSSIPPQGNFGQPAQSGGTDFVPVYYDGLIWYVG